MKRTLGGQRLGSGNKMQVELRNYERSTHDLGNLWRSTMAAGTLVPFLKRVALTGDTFDIELNCDVKTHPTVGPLFGSYKVQLDVFHCPFRLYQGTLHNNPLKVGMHMEQVKFPKMRLTATDITNGGINTVPDIDNAQINPSCLLSYLGVRGIGYWSGLGDTPQRNFNGVPLLAYWDIYKNYYANKQEEKGAVLYPNLVTPSLGGFTGAVIQSPVGAGPGTAYPILGGGAAASQELTPSTEFIFNYAAGPAPIANQLLIVLDSGLEIPLSEIAINITDTGSQLRGVYNYSKYGQQWTPYFRLINAADMPGAIPTIRTFDLNNLDVMRNKILAVAGVTTEFVINDQFLPGAVPIEPYNLLLEPQAGTLQYLGSQSGLALKTYQSDLFNNWLSTEWIDGVNGISAVTAIDTSGGSFTIDTLNMSKKVYDMLNRVAVSGGTYYDYLEVQYDHKQHMREETPVYIEGLSKELIFQEVVSNSQSQGTDGTQPLGTLAGKGAMAHKHKGGRITVKVDEPGYIIGIVSITPRIDYSQGNDWDMYALDNMSNLHVPALDEIGFQELITEQMAWWDTTRDVIGNKWVQKSAGKQPAWINYMTSVNQVYGNFAIATNEMFMTLNRRFEWDQDAQKIKDLSTYIDPSKFNNIFTQTALDAQNFWVQIAIDNTSRRKMSAKVMPNL